MNTLFARLCIALLAIVGLTSAGFLVVERFSSRLYYEEITQRLNAPIAMYVTGEQALITDGEVDYAALESLAHQAMVINPSVEVYLLDTGGRILGHALPPETIENDRVDLVPLQQLMSGASEFPIRGTDPRNAGRSKVFSVAEVRDRDVLQGYLYVVLGGRLYDELASDARGSYVRKLTLWSMAIVVFVSLAVGLLVFGLLTRRLSRLTRSVQRFSDSGFEDTDAVVWTSVRDDEIDRLGIACAAMSEKIGEQFESLKENDRLRRELISNVSHDLRTPLSSMQGYVETLLIKDDSLSSEDRRRYLATTRKHTQQLGRLIGDLFELSKLEAASVEPVFERFSLAELLQDVAQEFELEASDKDIHIAFEDVGADMPVYADIGLIQRVLENLLRNALKFTPEGGRISIRMDPRPESVSITVADTGCGIPDADLPQIFERFYGTRHGQKGGSNSSGLGLAIVKRILDLHGSRITVSSQIDRGTRFVFDLPTVKAA